MCWAVRSTASKPPELGPDELVAVGRDAECFTLAHAVQWHCERRVLLNGNVVVVR
jgi:formyltetrahydrofolate deformylase